VPKVSIITATYNGEKYIGRAIDSIRSQTLEDFEFIIVDDGSTDNTLSIINQYAAIDERIRVVTRAMASGGPTIPKNLALSLTRAPYVCFLDHDDYFHPDKIKELSEALDAHEDWVAVFHDLQLVDSDEQPHKGTYLSNADFCNAAKSFMQPVGDDWYQCASDFYNFMSLRYAAMHTDSVMLARHRLLKDPISFRLRFMGSDDTDLWLRVGAQGQMGYLDIVLAYYRQHEQNLSSDTLAMTRNAVEVHEENYLLARSRFSENELLAYRNKIAKYHFELGYKLSTAGKFSEAKRSYLNALRLRVDYRTLKGLIKVSVLDLMKS
jgi:glycosyltransferase involved in cell wall biosynthesis